MVHLVRTVDAHVGGQPVRLVVEGMPSPSGSTPARQREWLRRHADRLRRALVLPPRGSGDLTLALLTTTTSAGAHGGVLFMDGSGYPWMSGHGVMAVATIALERSLVFSRDDEGGEVRLVLDTPAGTVRVAARVEARNGSRRVDAVRVTNMPAFVQQASQPVRIGQRELRVDIAFGGAFYAIVDSEATGVPLESRRLPELRSLGEAICESLDRTVEVIHPANTRLSGVSGVVFTGPATDPEAHLRNLVVRREGVVDLSGSGTGTAAVMAVLDAMGLLVEEQFFVHESLAGSLLRGRAAGRTVVGEHPALVTEVEGSAWVTGEHTFFLDEDDPLTMRLS